MPESKYTRVLITIEGGLLADKEVVSISRAKPLSNTTELVDLLEASTQSILDAFVAITDMQPPAAPDGFDGL